MKIFCLLVVCVILSSCSNVQTSQNEQKMRFENLTTENVAMQYGAEAEWDEFYQNFYEQKEGSDIVVLGTVKDYTCFSSGIEIATDIVLEVNEILKGSMKTGENITIRKRGGAVTVEEYLQSMENAGITYWNGEDLKAEYSEEERREKYIQINFCDLDPVVGQKSIYFLKKDAEQDLYYRLCDGFGQYVEVSSDEYASAYEIADEKREENEPMLFRLEEEIKNDPEGETEEQIKIYTMEEIKKEMETEDSVTDVAETETGK